MKRLIIARHAESDINSADKDFDRPLNQRGLTDASDMGASLAAEQYDIDIIVCSPALRTLTTAKLFAEQLGFSNANIVQDSMLYNADIDSLLSIIHGFDDNCSNALLVAHNPGVSHLANHLTLSSVPGMPSCCMVNLLFPEATSWIDIQAAKGQLCFFRSPRKT